MTSTSKDDDFEGLFKDEDTSPLQEQFTQATIFVRKKTSEINKENLLYLYGRFKFANEGSCNTDRPGGLFNLEAKSKWDSWKSVDKNDSKMTKEKAKQEYIAKVETLFPKWNDNDPKNDQKYIQADKNGTFGIKTSTMTKENIRDEDKTCFDLCQEGSVEKLKIYLEKNPNSVNQTDENDMTMAMWACDRGHLEIVKLLFEKGANLNMQDSDGQTVLHYCCSNDQKEIIKYLKQGNKVNIDLTDNDGLRAVEMTDNQEIINIINSK